MNNENPSTQANDVKILKASRALEAKIGPGPLDEHLVKRAQDVMEKNDVDFEPLAEENLRTLSLALESLRESAQLDKKALQPVIKPVMQLKAHASIFGYPLIGTLANLVLGFLEDVQDVDADVIEIVRVHHMTLSAIIAKRMKGDGGPVGQQLQQELKDVIQRYFIRRPRG